MTKAVLIWELCGIVFVIILGSALHFAFALSGEWRPLAVIAAVNESTWEHLKLAFWPALLYGLAEYPFLRARAGNFLVAKAAGILLMPVAIVALFYAYTAFTEDTLVADILIFVMAVVAGQLTSLRLLPLRALPDALRWVAAAVLICLILTFALLTFFAPHVFLFRDPVTGGYGILAP